VIRVVLMSAFVLIVYVGLTTPINYAAISATFGELLMPLVAFSVALLLIGRSLQAKV
jgi:hypothetical protein